MFFDKLILFVLIIIILPISFSKIILRKLKFDNEITLIIKGNGGYQSYLSELIPAPNKLTINGEEVKNPQKNYKLTEEINTLIFSWDQPLISCHNMFYNFQNIIEIDLSKFDASKVSDMSSMFYNNNNLKTINFNNFDTSSVTNMEKMFSYCKNLTSLDLTGFNTSSVLIMDSMFESCTSLAKIDISKFDTHSVTSMNLMFQNAESLVSLDLSTFNISSLTSFRSTFIGCTSLVYLNLITFIEREDKYIALDSLLSNDQTNLIYCIDNNQAKRIFSTISKISKNNDCNNSCFSSSKKIIVGKKICTDNCANDDTYIYEYKNICYNKEEYESIIKEVETNEIINEPIKKTDKIKNTDKYSDDNQNINTNEITEKSTELFKSEKNEEIFTTNIITENIEKTSFIKKDYLTENVEIKDKIETTIYKSIINTDKLIGKETTIYKSIVNTDKFIGKETTIIKSIINTDKFIGKETTIIKSIINTDKLINKETTNINKPETNKTNSIYNSEQLFKLNQEINVETTSEKDNLIKCIKEDLIKGNLKSLIANLTSGDKTDLTSINKDIIYQITTTENQKNKTYSNISTINLGECEDKLKSVYKIDKNLSLLIFKVDFFMTGLLIPVIGYEVYHPLNFFQLDLNYCKDITIKLNIPVSINENKIYKHDPTSKYYNDECFTYTTEEGTDLILNDRQNDFNNNNLSLCEGSCTFYGYDTYTKKALCECETKPKITNISDIVNDGNILLVDFNTESTNSNLGAMKCVDTLFSKEGLLTNIGSYLLIFTFVFFTISTFVFYKCGYQIIEDNINRIIGSKHINKIKTDFKKGKSRNSCKKLSMKKNKRKSIKAKNESNPIKKKDAKKKKSIYKLDQNIVSSSNVRLKNQIKLKLTPTKEIKEEKNKLKQIVFEDCELNLMSYANALLYDKRKYGQYYMSLLLLKNPILFSFYPINDYNLKIIKINIFFLSFDIIFTINTFFFNDSTLHQIYKDGGKYNLSYFMPKIFYSFIISYIIMIFIKHFSSSQRNLLLLKNEDKYIKLEEKAEGIKRCLLIKYIVFYIFSFIYLLLFWYYLSSFCAVYQNSQIYLIKNTFMSFAIYILFPNFFILLTCTFRIYSLRGKSPMNKCFFETSKFMQII